MVYGQTDVTNYKVISIIEIRCSLNNALTANTDGIGNCLLQPGHIRNQLFTSMLVASIHLFNLVHHD